MQLTDAKGRQKRWILREGLTPMVELDALEFQLDKLKAEGVLPDEDLTTRMDEVRADYDRQLDARFAAARGFVDQIVLPEEIRPSLALLLRAGLNNPGPHVGPFHLPEEAP